MLRTKDFTLMKLPRRNLFPKEILDNIKLTRLITSADSSCKTAMRTQATSAQYPAAPQKARHLTR